MSVISNSLKNLSAFLQDHQVSFSNGLLILFTIGGEQIFRFNAFRCPRSQPDAYYYAIIFMIVPALVLGIIGIAVSNLTWRILHGCRHRSKKTQNSFSETLGYLFIATTRAAIVPCAWLFIALLDGNYYACMLAKQPGDKESDEILKLKAESQNIAWISLGGLITIAFVVICIYRCCDSVTYVQYKYLNSYREAEQQQMDKLMQASATELAETNVKAFIEQPRLKKEDWDKISELPDHTVEKKEIGDRRNHPKNLPSTTVELDGGSKVYLTALHEWVDLKKTQQQEEITPV